MSSYKMDYINDKNLFKAVMYACNLMKPPYNKYYSNAIGIASKTYNVNYEDIQHYVSQRSGRKKGKTTGIKYNYYIVGLFNYRDTHDAGERNFLNKIKVVRATSKEKASKTLKTTFKGYVSYKEYGEAFNFLMLYNDLEFDTKIDADNYLKENKLEINNYFLGKEY